MAYGDLLKQPAREVTAEPNPLRRLLGPGPEGARCKECEHLEGHTYAKTYYKCALRNNTGGPATDHRVNWKACAKFKRRGGNG